MFAASIIHDSQTWKQPQRWSVDERVVNETRPGHAPKCPSAMKTQDVPSPAATR